MPGKLKLGADCGIVAKRFQAIAMMFFGCEVKRQIDNLQDSDPEDIHLQTVAGKIWVTEHGARDVEVARLSCGGQGKWYVH